MGGYGEVMTSGDAALRPQSTSAPADSAAGIAGTEAAESHRLHGYGYGQRLISIFWGWWYGVMLIIAGVSDAALSFNLNQGTDRGISMAVIGGGILIIGWLLTLRLRFTRNIPKPASYGWRVERGIKASPMAVKVCAICTVVIVVALAVFTPSGGLPEIIPILGLVTAVGLTLTAGLAYSGWLMKNSGELYARWLERRNR